jgi:hypothetical protein
MDAGNWEFETVSLQMVSTMLTVSKHAATSLVFLFSSQGNIWKVGTSFFKA